VNVFNHVLACTRCQKQLLGVKGYFDKGEVEYTQSEGFVILCIYCTSLTSPVFIVTPLDDYLDGEIGVHAAADSFPPPYYHPSHELLPKP
jgi:hypothetical protein